ncbi:MAG: alanine racemase [Solirubrobacteraceae bacterium]|nr:alanine racemase [Solirubrobacteraceae bacterium]
MTAPTPPARVLLTDVDVDVVAARLGELREMLAAAAKASGRDRGPDVLVASKYFDPVAIPALVRAGATLLGENRAGALEPKQAAVPSDVAVQWDYIGELQSRKAAGIAAQVDRIHTLASVSAARKLTAAADTGSVIPELLIQVNVAGEVAKGGVAPHDLDALLEAASGLPVRGLMTMPPLATEPAESRRWFAALRELAGARGLDQLSMGTSQDAVAAAAEGATVVRIGGLLTSDTAWQGLVREQG